MLNMRMLLRMTAGLAWMPADGTKATVEGGPPCVTVGSLRTRFRHVLVSINLQSTSTCSHQNAQATSSHAVLPRVPPLLLLLFCLQDLDALLSAFTAKPWRRGFLHTLTFLVRTKAAYAYPTYTCRACRGHTCTCTVDPLLDPASITNVRGMNDEYVASNRDWDSSGVARSMKDCEDAGWPRDDSTKGVESSAVTDRAGLGHGGVTVEAPARSGYGDGSSSTAS
jgi:hypothetical protein